MESSDLVARENEFKKLNKQLEKKTESLMKEIENVMQKQDIFSDISYKLRLTPSPVNVKKHICNSTGTSWVNSGSNFRTKSHPNIAKKKASNILKDDGRIKSICNGDRQHNNNNRDHLNPSSEHSCASQKEVVCQNCMVNKSGRLSNDIEFLYAFVSINVKDNILPESFLKERVTVESVCKFLSAKVRLLQEQIAIMQNNMEKKGKQCEGHLAQIAELEGERMSLLGKANKAKADVTEGRAKYMALQAHIEEKDRLFKEQRSATDKLSTEAKQLRGKVIALEARCAAHEETEAGLKQQLAVARTTHQEIRESSRSQSAHQEDALRRLEARAGRLASCVLRQNALIDNLKQQNALLSAHGATATLASEYDQFLKQHL